MDHGSIVSLADYTTMDRPVLNCLVENLVPFPGMVLLCGEPGSGKSFLALQLGLAVAHGGEFFKERCRKGRVLYLHFEMSEQIIRDRLTKLGKAGVDITGEIYTLHPEIAPRGLDILKPLDFSILEEVIDKAKPDLVIFDVLREMHNKDEDNSGEMKVVMDQIIRLCRGRAGLIVHHTRKLSTGLEPKAIDSSRGSSYIPGKVDTVWLLHDGFLYIGKNRLAPGGKYRLRQAPSGLWLFS